jgi:hypothetical protein
MISDDAFRLTLASAVVLCLPGFALAQLIGKLGQGKIDSITSLGLSLAVMPIGFLALSLVHLPVNRNGLLAGLFLCVVIIVTQLFVRRRQPSDDEVERRHHPAAPGARLIRRHWPLLGLSLIFAATLLWRFIQIRELVLPAWVDSLHHTQIVDVLRTEGRIPAELFTYAPTPFYYHFGFHVTAAAFAELADLPSAQAILVLGQILNAVCVLAVYRLAVALTRRASIGLLAAALTGFVSQMPAYFASWGRYTLLTGLILLALAMASVVEVWRYPAQRWRRWLLIVLVAGLVLTHYVAAVYFCCFALALLLGGRMAEQPLWPRCRAVIIGIAAGVIIVSPWLVHIATLVGPQATLRTGAAVTDNVMFRAEMLGRVGHTALLISPLRMWPVFALAALAVGFYRGRQQTTRLLLLWLIILVGLSNEWLWRVGPLRGDLLLLGLFMPINILAAVGFMRLRRLSFRLNQRWRAWAPNALLALLLIYSAADTISIINPITVLATSEDVVALNWVKANTPIEAHFAINVAAWGALYRGVDGGWWLPLISQRTTILPPGIFYGVAVDPQVKLSVQAAAEQVSIIDGCTPYFWWVVRQQQITHLYVSDRGGPLRADWLNTCAGIERIYTNRRVAIYRVSNWSF